LFILKDLINEINKAQNTVNEWDELAIRNEISAFLSYSNSNNIIWDDDAGEEWISFCFEKELLAILNVKIPLCFVKENDKYRFMSKNYHTVVIQDF
jgi:hypothetical protein